MFDGWFVHLLQVLLIERITLNGLQPGEVLLG